MEDDPSTNISAPLIKTINPTTKPIIDKNIFPPLKIKIFIM
jgi:hypothetical protein